LHVAVAASVSFCCLFFFSSRRRHTRSTRDWSSDVCSSDLRVRWARRHQARSRSQYLHRYGERDLAWWRLAQRTLSPWMAAVLGEIGRASCRERVGSRGGAGGQTERETNT